MQLGLKGKWLQMLGSGDAVVRIERLDGLLAEQRAALASSAPQNLAVPVARALDVGHLQVRVVPGYTFASLHRRAGERGEKIYRFVPTTEARFSVLKLCYDPIPAGHNSIPLLAAAAALNSTLLKSRRYLAHGVLIHFRTLS